MARAASAAAEALSVSAGGGASSPWPNAWDSPPRHASSVYDGTADGSRAAAATRSHPRPALASQPSPGRDASFYRDAHEHWARDVHDLLNPAMKQEHSAALAKWRAARGISTSPDRSTLGVQTADDSLHSPPKRDAGTLARPSSDGRVAAAFGLKKTRLLQEQLQMLCSSDGQNVSVDEALRILQSVEDALADNESSSAATSSRGRPTKSTSSGAGPNTTSRSASVQVENPAVTATTRAIDTQTATEPRSVTPPPPPPPPPQPTAASSSPATAASAARGGEPDDDGSAPATRLPRLGLADRLPPRRSSFTAQQQHQQVSRRMGEGGHHQRGTSPSSRPASVAAMAAAAQPPPHYHHHPHQQQQQQRALTPQEVQAYQQWWSAYQAWYGQQMSASQHQQQQQQPAATGSHRHRNSADTTTQSDKRGRPNWREHLRRRTERSSRSASRDRQQPSATSSRSQSRGGDRGLDAGADRHPHHNNNYYSHADPYDAGFSARSVAELAAAQLQHEDLSSRSPASHPQPHHTDTSAAAFRSPLRSSIVAAAAARAALGSLDAVSPLTDDGSSSDVDNDSTPTSSLSGATSRTATPPQMPSHDAHNDSWVRRTTSPSRGGVGGATASSRARSAAAREQRHAMAHVVPSGRSALSPRRDRNPAYAEQLERRRVHVAQRDRWNSSIVTADRGGGAGRQAPPTRRPSSRSASGTRRGGGGTATSAWR